MEAVMLGLTPEGAKDPGGLIHAFHLIVRSLSEDSNMRKTILRSLRRHFTLQLFLSLIAIAIIATTTPASASRLPNTPYSHIVDLAGIIDNEVEDKATRLLMELEQKTGAQVVLLSVDSLEGRALEEFSLNVAEKWGLGQRGIDNGMLILFAMKERKYRFEVGYGLEGILPDSLVGSIGREHIVPNFKKGAYSKGALAAAHAVVRIIARDKGVTLNGLPRMSSPVQKHKSKDSFWDRVFLILFGLFIFYVFYKVLTHPPGSGGGGGSGWGGGYYSGGGSSGFGSGGGGGFSGGGGGFGGGGASGGW
jgi:uncharacterized protein